jgi:uncharacterized protein (TIGR02453 family)
MLNKNTLAFLEGLAGNNNKPWFEANKDAYEGAKADFEHFVAEILAGLATSEPGFLEQKAKDCIFRIYRDVRFSKDKSPYKANFGAYFSKGGKKFNGAGYYFHLDPGKSFAGGGLWMPEPEILKKVRQEIDYNFGEFQSIIENATFKKLFGTIRGEQLKKVPQGYDSTNPAAELLKFKSFTVSNTVGDVELLQSGIIGHCLEVYGAMRPLLDFLNRAVD